MVVKLAVKNKRRRMVRRMFAIRGLKNRTVGYFVQLGGMGGVVFVSETVGRWGSSCII